MAKDGIQKLENRIQKLIREEQKWEIIIIFNYRVKTKMELTRRFGAKLADVMDFKVSAK